MRVTTLVENRGAGELGGEHGIAFWVEVQGERPLLFDTGQSGILVQNAQRLGVDLAHTRAIIFSHGHYDHTNGLSTVLEKARPERIYVPVNFFAGHFRGEHKYIGMNFTRQELQARGLQIVSVTDDVIDLGSNVFIITNIPRSTDYEVVTDPFMIEQNGQLVAEDFQDELALVLRTKQGVVLLVGCSHCGVVNIARHAARAFGENRIFALIGGTHLVSADAARINNTIADLRDLGVELLAASHCTGEKAERQMRAAFKEKFCPNVSGTTFSFP